MNTLDKRGSSQSSPVIMEGILEKLKEREFPWILSGKKLSTTWILRYYVLRHADINDPEAFFLEQHEDCTPFSKVRKTLDLRCVEQVITNISLKVGSQNWILAIHYKTKHRKKSKVLYLAAHSETEMNLWTSKLCYACKLERQEDEENMLVSDGNANESSIMASPRDNRYLSDNSVSHSPSRTAIHQTDYSSRVPINRNTNDNDGNQMTTHAYIRLKDCSSTRSFGSSSASLSSTITTSSSTTQDHSTSENPSFRNSFLIPPPIPPKPSPGLRMKKAGNRNTDSDGYILDQPLTPPDISMLSAEKEDWSNETIRPDVTRSNNGDRSSLPCDSSAAPTACDTSAPKPLPRRRDYRNIPPEVDRSCKPTGKNRNKCVSTNIGQERQSSDERRREACVTSPRMFLSHFSHQQPLPPVASQNNQVPSGQEAVYDNRLMGTTNEILDYLDPVTEPLAQAPTVVKSSQRSKSSCATEYTQIDEESTKAVLEANVRQDEIRRSGFPV